MSDSQERTGWLMDVSTLDGSCHMLYNEWEMFRIEVQD